MSTRGKPNILLIIADDLGADNVLVTDRRPERRMYVITGEGSAPPHGLPSGPIILGELAILSILLRCGLEFAQAWAQPLCSPTRGSVYTGTWPWRNGVGSPADPQLDSALVTALPRLLGPEGYECGLFGKWHCGTLAGRRPPDHGWDRHIGTLHGDVPDYMNWPKQDSDNGYAVVPNSTVYATRETVEDAGSWIAGLPVDTPWFATIAFHTPHEPFHTPPDGYQLPNGLPPATDSEKFNAMTQNMDYHIGRLLGTGAGPALHSIASDQLENTVIIFLGDNGSPEGIAPEEAKASIFEGGVRVPMSVADGQAGAREMRGRRPVPRFLAAAKLNRTSPRLVHAVDLYETITEIAQVRAALPTNIDSVSLWRFPSLPDPQPPTRQFNFAQWYSNGLKRVTIRKLDYKLNYEHPNQWSLYAYYGGEVPGLENGSAQNIYSSALADIQAGVSNDAADNLNALLDELICSGNYAMDSAGTAWVDPR